MLSILIAVITDPSDWQREREREIFVWRLANYFSFAVSNKDEEVRKLPG